MKSSNSTHFYSELTVYEDGLITHLSHKDRFQEIPEDWHVIITDIKDSTKAIQQGKHQQVNLVATASIISALNISKKEHIDFPFFFGGDGATLIIPKSMLKAVNSALKVYQRNVKAMFDMELRVDEIPVSDIYKAGQSLLISKTKVSKEYTIPVILGEGLIFADDEIKKRRIEYKEELDEESLNLEGMECRWDAVKPSEDTKQVVCLLLRMQPNVDQATVFGRVLKAIEDIYGSFVERRPISVEALELSASLDRYKNENDLKYGKKSLLRLIKSAIGIIIGKVYLKRGNGKNYLKSLVELSDTLVLNGMMNTVFSGTDSQRKQLDAELEKLEQEGQLFYGMNVCSESILSCYVQDRINNHVHFIDGSEGGYTAAATVLKRKLANM